VYAWNEKRFFNLSIKIIENINLKVLPFSSEKIQSTKRIGPHNYEVLCILIGSLLGDGHIEKDGNGSRFCFYQKGEHIEYILWLHSILFKCGYCKENKPQIQSRIINGKLSYYCRFQTFTYSSFNWIYEEFYVNKVKTIPTWIESYISPIALAIWIMDDGGWIKNRGIKLSTNCFTLSEVKRLVFYLKININ
jgi:ubiquinol-cytochrome c reductase cytochrome b subunit